MGGAIALDLALRHPARVSGLGLVATGARLRVAPAILDGIKQDPEATVGLICRWAFGPEAPEEMLRLGRRQMQTTAPEVLHGDFAACDAFDVLDQLTEISTPTLVLGGTRDALTPTKYAVHLRDQIAGAELHLVEGAGHMLMVERPTAVSRALAGFLEKL
jgi:pimeloyl-ACP methyl ester carboxylesterase